MRSHIVNQSLFGTEDIDRCIEDVRFDALAIGISLAMAGNVNIWVAIALIGIITCVLSAIGVKIGNIFGSKFEKKAQMAGGFILILLGTKILLEHLGVL